MTPSCSRNIPPDRHRPPRLIRLTSLRYPKKPRVRKATAGISKMPLKLRIIQRRKAKLPKKIGRLYKMKTKKIHSSSRLRRKAAKKSKPKMTRGSKCLTRLSRRNCRPKSRQSLKRRTKDGFSYVFGRRKYGEIRCQG